MSNDPNLSELDRLTQKTVSAENRADHETQINRSTYLILARITVQLTEIGAEVKRVGQYVDTSGPKIQRATEDINGLKKKAQQQDDELQALRKHNETFPSLIYVAYRHPLAALAVTIILLGLIVWLAGLSPEDAGAFFGIFR